LYKLFTLFLLFNSVLVGQVSFAAIGDYGKGGSAEAEVSDMIDTWNVDFIITLGDNNYNYGEWSTIDNNIGKDYNQWIYPYVGNYPPRGSQDAVNRFFPCPGNHDYNTSDAWPYYQYFDMMPYSQTSGNERYYDFVWDNVHFFSVNSCVQEPDGYRQPSIQATWLENQLADCVINHSHWRLVYFHHSPYSSDKQVSWSRWTFAEFGAHVVLSGHSHTYERIFRNGIVYFVNGLGGKSLYSCGSLVEGSQGCYNDNYGAMLVSVISNTKLLFEFYYRDGTLVDSYLLEDSSLPVELVSFRAKVQNSDVLLEWQTANELNNFGFEVERKDNFLWYKIGFHEGSGNSSSPKYYNFVDDNVGATTYYYRLKQIDTDGNFTYSHEIVVTVEVPTYFSLGQNYPNPFNPSTKIKYSIPQVASSFSLRATLVVYDVLGNKIATLVDEEKPAGSYEVEFDGSELTSRIYFYRLQTGDFIETKKMVLMK
jgi:hypothetical protein